MKHIFVILHIFISGLMDILQLDELFSLVLAGCGVEPFSLINQNKLLVI